MSWSVGRVALMVLVVLVGSYGKVEAQDPATREDVRVFKEMSYVPDGHERQRLDLYVPQSTNGPLPVIVWIHGGAWRAGSKENPPVMRYTRQGYALASVNYRLSQHASFPAQIQDCQAAIRWLRAHAKEYGLDENRIGVCGASAGGHLVALLGTAPENPPWEAIGEHRSLSARVQCVVDLFGPSDLARLAPQNATADSAIARLLGGPPSEKAELARQASPVSFVTPDDPPFLILHGDQDPLVPLEQSELLADTLKKAGVEVTLVTLKGARHGGPAFSGTDVTSTMDRFFAKHLKHEDASPASNGQGQ
ncbi:MAG: hypothetical protein KatS3mg109_0529 [Pirellulaceae bacterium]|nr:MAG: hypothetical protein KatS3mg109_0529 [Pirellulaceae bacterium]